MDAAFIVLAGGKGLRLGQDKASEIIGDRSLLERVVSRLIPFDCDIYIVTASERVFPSLSRSIKTVTDIHRDKGPLGGIYAGLKASDATYNLVVACDMPFLNRDLLGYMLRVARGYDLAAPRVGELVEPLHAVYSRGCLAPIESLLERGDLRVRQLFGLVKMRYVEAEEIDRFDPQHLSFFNINDEADLARARDLARKEI